MDYETPRTMTMQQKRISSSEDNLGPEHLFRGLREKFPVDLRPKFDHSAA